MRLLASVAFAALLVAPYYLHAEEAVADRQGAGETLEAEPQVLVGVEQASEQGDLRALQRVSAGAPPASGDRPVLGQASDSETHVHRTLGVKLDAGRDRAALGRLPSDPRQTYGEVGLAIDLGDAFSMQPSYRLNWTDSEEEGRDGVADHALKLGANFKF
jgi:hypothetical protein